MHPLCARVLSPSPAGSLQDTPPPVRASLSDALVRPISYAMQQRLH